MKSTHKVYLTKIFKSNSKSILNLFKDGTVFRLTGADVIQFDFREGEKFQLTFKHRGKIYGSFTKISDDELIIDWNVEGFNRPKESNSLLKISLFQKDDQCELKLGHSNILNKEAAIAKKNAWTEILNDIEKKIS